jgi:hypothetical protein
MEGQFHKKQHLIRDDKDNVIGIVLSGPITKWGPGEPGATISARIEQDGVVKAEGRTAADVPNGSEAWMFVVPVDAGALAPGPAQGHANDAGGWWKCGPIDVELV